VPCREWINPNETVALELNDGRVMLNVPGANPKRTAAS
jgi:hypothetical protein